MFDALAAPIRSAFAFIDPELGRRRSRPAAPVGARLLGLVLEHADRETPLGGGRVALSVSRARLADPAVRRAFGASADEAADLRVVWNEACAEVVSVLHGPVRRAA